jgi:hypothetical protein
MQHAARRACARLLARGRDFGKRVISLVSSWVRPMRPYPTQDDLERSIAALTEAYWLGEPAPGQALEHFRYMLQFVRGKTSPRKLWLFASACYRRKWPLLNDVASSNAVELAERHAEGLAGRGCLRSIARDLQRTDECCRQSVICEQTATRARSPDGSLVIPPTGWRPSRPEADLHNRAREALERANRSAKEGELPKVQVLVLLGFTTPGEWVDAQATRSAWEIASTAALFALSGAAVARAQVHLLRHIVGNPFQPCPAAQYTTTLLQLAEAAYQGQDCLFALHDALVDAGHQVLAEHFKAEPWHPKGCWALDLLLGKK